MKLLINADDFGISGSVNKAIDYCFKNGIIHRTTLMVNMASCDEAVTMAKQGGYFDKVGLHINLIEGKPLTHKIKNTVFCTNGVFNGLALKNQKNRFYLNKTVAEAVREELIAQIEKYISYGFTLMHLDSHQHSHTNPSIFRILHPLLTKYGFASVRLSRNIPEDKITGLKKLYKTAFNRQIMKLNQKSVATPWYVTYFGSQADVDDMANDAACSKKIEVEVHPDMQEGVLKDLLYHTDVESWLRTNRRFII